MNDLAPGRKRRILVLGTGFAGLWAAIGAARKRAELGIGPDVIEVTAVNRTAFHSIRVRNYEADLSETLVPLGDVLDPAGVRHVVGEVTDIAPDERSVTCMVEGTPQRLGYDRLVFALGSRLVRPDVPGLRDHGFDVDTYEGASRLNAHIAALPSKPASDGQYTVLVIGAGLTGIEAAAEMFGKLRAACAADGAAPAGKLRVILTDRHAPIGSGMGESAGPVIAEALRTLGVEMRAGEAVASVDGQGATLATGERIAAETVVWCGGMQAHPLAARIPVIRDRLGRLPVDHCLKVEGRTEFAAGDSAWLLIDDVHPSVMSCQHARPMGRFAGHNVVCDLLGLPMLPLRIDWYVTVLDLGPWGAVYTEGQDRRLVARDAEAKRIKETINRQRIYPPRSRVARDILGAAAPVAQAPPPQSH